MSNSYFQFKQFTIHQERCAMKVTTDACLFGAWVAEKLKTGRPEVKRILDIGAGTGLLSLLIAQKINAPIDSIEMDPEAFQQAKENIAASPWSDRINIFHGDATQFNFTSDYNIIVSNPPFYENELPSMNEKRNNAMHGGLSLNELLEVITKILGAEGRFYLLLPAKRVREISFLLPKWKLSITESALIKQTPAHDHFRIFLAGKHAGDNEIRGPEKEIIISNKEKQYTGDFINLLKDYYLYL